MRFKIFNFNRPSCEINSERMESMREYDGEYNYELDNEYFENVWFYSNLNLELIEFQIFFTTYEYFRLPHIYTNPEYIQAYYEKEYQTPFFYNLSSPELKKKYHPTMQLAKFLNFREFKEVIKPHLNLRLIGKIDPENLNNSGYYLFHNWEFYTELQISLNSNSLLRYIGSIPFGTKSFYEVEKKAKLSAINVMLENASSTVDTILNGLNFKLSQMNPGIFTQESYNDNFWLAPKIRNIKIQDESDTLMQGQVEDINDYLKIFEKKGLKPFVIEDRR